MSATVVSEASPGPAGRRRNAWRWAVAVVALAALPGVERGARLLSAVLGSPTGTARWIWADLDAWNKAEPAAFDIACDFQLPLVPADATLAVQGDEEYIVWLNGRAVGSGRFVPGGALRSFAVGRLLQAGGNRLLARVRSARGEGGFLASVRGAGRQWLASGDSCRIFKPADQGIVQGWLNLPAEGSPVVWGLPPTGRWGAAVLGATEEPAALVAQPASLPSVRRRVAALQSLEENAGEMTLFEWPRTVTGVLRLRLAPRPGTSGLIFLGETVPDPRAHRGERVIVTADQDREWLDVVPQRFRYVLVAGLAGVRGAEVLRTGEDAVPPPSPPRGVFGVQPPPSRSPVEDEIRRRLGNLDHLEFSSPAALAVAEDDGGQAPPD